MKRNHVFKQNLFQAHKLLIATTVFLLSVFAPSALAQVSFDSEHTIMVDGIPRTYILHVPANHPASSPLVLVFHGGGGRATGTQAITSMNTVADEHGFVAAFPQGLMTTWNDGGSDLGQKPPRDDVSFTRQMVADIAKAVPIDRQQVFTCGFSNGATFSTRLALEASDLFAAAAIVSGGMYPKQRQEHPNPNPISILMIEGTADPCFPFDGGLTTAPKMGGAFTGAHHGVAFSAEDTLAFWRRVDHCREEPQVSAVPHLTRDDTNTTYKIWTGANGCDVAEYIVTNGGHCWPGGIQYFPVNVIGKTTYDFKASEAIWRFFSEHGKH